MGDTRSRSEAVGTHKGTLLSIRLDAELRRQIKEHRARLQAATPYQPVPESAAVRDLLLRGLTTVQPKKAR